MLASGVLGTLDHLILADLSFPRGLDSHSVPALLLLQTCRGTLVDATILEGTFQQKDDEDRTIGGALREIMFCFRCETVRALVEYEATTAVVDIISPPGNGKGTTSLYRTIRVQKWLSIPKGKRAGSTTNNPLLLPVMVLPGRPRSAIVQEQHCPRILCFILVLLVNIVFTSSGVWLPLWMFGYLDSECDYYDDDDDDGGGDCVDGCGRRSWDVQLAYVIAAVVASLLLRINNVTEPSVVTVTVAGEEMKDMMSTGVHNDTFASDTETTETVPMLFDSDTFASDTETTETSIC